MTGPSPRPGLPEAPRLAETTGPTEEVAAATGPIEGFAEAAGPIEGFAQATGPIEGFAQATGPIEEHVAALAAALHGPARVKARLLREAHDGLTDAAEAIAAAGKPDALTPDAGTIDVGASDVGASDVGGREVECGIGVDAERAAVREFGAIVEVAPEFQRELTIAQARRTALGVVLAVPVLVLLGRLAVTAGPILPYADALPYAARVAAAHLGGFASAAALLAAGALAVTGALARHITTPGRLPLVIAWAGTAASASIAAGALTLTGAALFAGDWPLSLLAGAFALVAHARLAASARACRHCAHLPSAPTS